MKTLSFYVIRHWSADRFVSKLFRSIHCCSAPLAPIVLALAAAAVPVAAAPPPFEWANLAGTPNQDWGRATAVDPAGNVYVVGSFDGTATFGTNVLTSSGGSNRPDLFVAKYNNAGQVVWVRAAGGTGTDQAFGVALDADGNVIVTGSSDSVPFGSSGTSFNVSGRKAVFLKFNNAGTQLWARVSLPQAFFPPPDGTGIAAGADAGGNLYFAGHFTGPINFGGTPGIFPPPTGGIAFDNPAETDVFLLKYTAAGTIVWARQIGGANLQEVRSMAVTPAGDIYLCGRFNGTSSFGGTNLTSGNTSFDTDVFVGRWDANGNLVWVRQFGSNETDVGLGVAVDSTGAPHFAAAFKGIQFTVGSKTYTNANLSYDAVVAKLSQGGVPQWSMPIERPVTLPDEGFGIAIDRDNNVLVTGIAGAGARIGSMPWPTAPGWFFAALIENGDPVWVKSAGVSTGDYGSGIGVDAAGAIYVTGTVGGNVMDPGTPVVFDSLAPVSFGKRDLFVAKIASILPPPGPSMSFALSGGNLEVSWPLADAAFVLECSTDPGAGYGPTLEPRVTNTVAQTIRVTIAPTGIQKFYRLRR